MPTEEQLRNTKLRKKPVFADSRDYRGTDFLDYVDPSFYRVNDTKIENFLAWDTLRSNGELIAINEPTLTTALQYPPSKLVSPDMPTGIYKKGAVATLFYFIDGQQVQVRYRLVSLSAGNVETLSEQVGKQILERFLGKYSELARKLSIFGIGESLADVADYLTKQMNAPDVFGVWLRVGAVSESIESVTQPTRTGGAFTDTTEEETETETSLPLGLLLTGAGLVTGNLWLSGLGLLLRFRTDSAEEETETETNTTPKRGNRKFRGL